MMRTYKEFRGQLQKAFEKISSELEKGSMFREEFENLGGLMTNHFDSYRFVFQLQDLLAAQSLIRRIRAAQKSNQFPASSAVDDFAKLIQSRQHEFDHCKTSNDDFRRESPDDPMVVPPNGLQHLSAHHWVELYSSDGPLIDRIVLQWQPIARQWCHSGMAATGNHFPVARLEHARYGGPCPMYLETGEAAHLKVIIDMIHDRQMLDPLSGEFLTGILKTLVV